MSILKDLQPQDVFAYFEQISAVPRPSDSPQAIGDYCEAFAREHGLRCIRDKAGNVVIFKDGAPDKEPVILQGHLDMVCVSDPDVKIDFHRDPLPLATDGEYIFCRGTSLGADDGIAVAMILALLASDTHELPPIEAVFTSDEEVGMGGASALDTSVLQGRRMLNLDSEAEGTFWVSCAGGERVTVTKEPESEPYAGDCLLVRLSGLTGGHSGTEIGKGRRNAVLCMAELLREVPGVRLNQLSGGKVDNAIPSECTAVFTGRNVSALENAFSARLETWRAAEPDIRLDVTTVGADSLLTQESTRGVLDLLAALPNGVQGWSREIEGFVETSLNLGVCKVDTHGLTLHYSVRSGIDAERDALVERVKKIAADHGGKSETHGKYPAWQYRRDSPLRDAAVQAYESLFGKKPKIEGIHAGLECGLFCGKLPDLDCISLGPDIFDIHSPKERMRIASAARTYALLLDVLKRL